MHEVFTLCAQRKASKESKSIEKQGGKSIRKCIDVHAVWFIRFLIKVFLKLRVFFLTFYYNSYRLQLLKPTDCSITILIQPQRISTKPRL